MLPAGICEQIVIVPGILTACGSIEAAPAGHFGEHFRVNCAAAVGSAQDQILESFRFDTVYLHPGKLIGNDQIIEQHIDAQEEAKSGGKRKQFLKNSHR